MPRLLMIAAIVVAGCASGPEIFDRQPWAKVSKQQAEAECYNEINTNAGRGSNFYLCMKAKGWEQR